MHLNKFSGMGNLVDQNGKFNAVPSRRTLLGQHKHAMFADVTAPPDTVKGGPFSSLPPKLNGGLEWKSDLRSGGSHVDQLVRHFSEFTLCKDCRLGK